MYKPVNLHQRRVAKEKDNLIPLINIVFLLLIFFMVAGQMQKPLVDALTPPSSTLAEPLKTTGVTIEYNKNSELFLDSEKVNVESIAQYLKKNANANQRYYLRIDKDVTAEKLEKLLSLFRHNNIKNIVMAVEPILSVASNS